MRLYVSRSNKSFYWNPTGMLLVLIEIFCYMAITAYFTDRIEDKGYILLTYFSPMLYFYIHRKPEVF